MPVCGGMKAYNERCVKYCSQGVQTWFYQSIPSAQDPILDLGTGDRCSVTRMAGEVDVHVSPVSPAQQSHSETVDHPGGQSDINK